MAGIQLKKKVQASTLLEVVISMVVILVVFGIAMMIFTNVTGFSVSGKEVRARAILRDELMKAEDTKIFIAQTLNVADFKIEQTVSQYGDNKNLLLVQLTAYDKNQLEVALLKKVEINWQ